MDTATIVNGPVTDPDIAAIKSENARLRKALGGYKAMETMRKKRGEGDKPAPTPATTPAPGVQTAAKPRVTDLVSDAVASLNRFWEGA